MSCPVGQRLAEQPVTSDPPSAFTDVSAGDVVDRFEQVAGSVFLGLFGAALFDQTMLPAVSAALEDTGRIRNDPWRRALRTAASDQIAFLGVEADRCAEMERLKTLHRDVRGVGPDGVRYSALTPESWNWILISTFFMHRNAFVAITGEKLSAADDQAIWDRFRNLLEGLQLSGHSRLAEDYGDLCSYYDSMGAEKLRVTSTLDGVVEEILRPTRPYFVPAVAAPLWRLIGPIVGHCTCVLGFGVMRPGVRALIPVKWTRRHAFEFAVMTAAIRFAYKRLPARFTDTPLARNRKEYQRLMKQYNGIGLTSFAPNSSKVIR